MRPMRLLQQTELDALVQRAAQSPRGRAHLNLHAADTDLVQRFFVAFEPRSYVRPHRHLARAELAVVLRGALDVVRFDAAGRVLARESLGSGTAAFAYEAPPGGWHTLLAREPGTVILEVKEGPYDPATAAEFAAWAPEEGSDLVPAFQAWLREADPGARPP